MITWDPLTYIHSIPAESSSSIYSDCVVASPATSAPPTSAVTASTEPPTAAAASSALGTVIPHFVFSILLLVPLLVYNIG